MRGEQARLGVVGFGVIVVAVAAAACKAEQSDCTSSVSNERQAALAVACRAAPNNPETSGAVWESVGCPIR